MRIHKKALKTIYIEPSKQQTQNNVIFSILKKLENFTNFLEILGNFSKIIGGTKSTNFENSFLKMQ